MPLPLSRKRESLVRRHPSGYSAGQMPPETESISPVT